MTIKASKKALERAEVCLKQLELWDKRDEAAREAKKDSDGERLQLLNQIEEIKRKSEEDIQEYRAQNE